MRSIAYGHFSLSPLELTPTSFALQLYTLSPRAPVVHYADAKPLAQSIVFV